MADVLHMDYGLSEIHSTVISGVCVYRMRIFQAVFYLWVKLGSQNRLAAILLLGKKTLTECRRARPVGQAFLWPES